MLERKDRIKAYIEEDTKSVEELKILRTRLYNIHREASNVFKDAITHIEKNISKLREEEWENAHGNKKHITYRRLS